MYRSSRDNIWQQQKQVIEYQNDCREIQKAAAKTVAIENVRIHSMQVKSQIREQERERKKTVGETVQIMANGELQIVTENLRIETIPRQVSNMRYPELIVLKRQIDDNEQIFQINFFVAEKKKSVFLEKNQAGSGTYILRKFACEGAYFKMETAKGKKLAVRLIAILQEMCNEERLLPEIEGWMKMPNGEFRYVGKEDLTWEKAKKGCR